MIDLFDIWQSAQQPFKDFEKEMIEVMAEIKGVDFADAEFILKQEPEIYTSDFLTSFSISL